MLVPVSFASLVFALHITFSLPLMLLDQFHFLPPLVIRPISLFVSLCACIASSPLVATLGVCTVSFSFAALGVAQPVPIFIFHLLLVLIGVALAVSSFFADLFVSIGLFVTTVSVASPVSFVATPVVVIHYHHCQSYLHCQFHCIPQCLHCLIFMPISFFATLSSVPPVWYFVLASIKQTSLMTNFVPVCLLLSHLGVAAAGASIMGAAADATT